MLSNSLLDLLLGADVARVSTLPLPAVGSTWMKAGVAPGSYMYPIKTATPRNNMLAFNINFAKNMYILISILLPRKLKLSRSN